MISGNGSFLPPKNLIKLSYTLNKTHLGSHRRNWMHEQLLFFTGCSSIQFFNSRPFSKNSQLGHTWYLQKYIFKYTLSKQLIFQKPTFSKLLPQKIYFQKTYLQNCCLKKNIIENYIFKIVLSKNINFISWIYSLSESSELSEELSKSSIICLAWDFILVFKGILL